MNDLLAFLTARLDEDERIATAASPGPWITVEAECDLVDVESELGHVVRSCRDCLTEGCDHFDAQHIARHDPARVLRDVEAKRKIIGQYERVRETRRAHPDDMPSTGAHLVLHGAVTTLAYAHANHPDYRSEWAPQ